MTGFPSANRLVCKVGRKAATVRSQLISMLPWLSKQANKKYIEITELVKTIITLNAVSGFPTHKEQAWGNEENRHD